MPAKDKILLAKLNEAVRRLKANGTIKFDNEIAADLDYSPPTVSQILSGATPLSSQFLKKFEKKYKVEVAKIILPDQKEPIYEDINTRLLLLIALKLGVSKAEITKVMK